MISNDIKYNLKWNKFYYEHSDYVIIGRKWKDNSRQRNF